MRHNPHIDSASFAGYPMIMGLTAIYDGTLSLAIVLISLVVPVFVFSVSLLGQAVESARKEREQAEKQKQTELEERIEALKLELDEAKRTTDVSCVSSLSKEIGQLQGEKKRVLKRIERTSTALTVKGAVLWPGLFFLVALALTVASKALSRIPVAQSQLSWGFITWLLAVGSLSFGLRLLWRVLVVVQLVAVRSQETAHRKMVSAFKQAQQELDTERRPEFSLSWLETHPFSFSPGEKRSLSYSFHLTKGQSAEQAEVWFFVDKGIELPAHESWAQSDEAGDVAGLTTTIIKYGETLIPSTNYGRTLTVKAPDQKGEFWILVSCKCIGFSSPARERFKIIVGAPDGPF